MTLIESEETPKTREWDGLEFYRTGFRSKRPPIVYEKCASISAEGREFRVVHTSEGYYYIYIKFEGQDEKSDKVVEKPELVEVLV